MKHFHNIVWWFLDVPKHCLPMFLMFRQVMKRHKPLLVHIILSDVFWSRNAQIEPQVSMNDRFWAWGSPHVRFTHKPNSFYDLEGLDLVMARPFLSWPSSHPGSAQKIVHACFRKDTGPEKQTGQATKNDSVPVYFWACLAWETSNQIYVP